jgi:hypothetical protein
MSLRQARRVDLDASAGHKLGGGTPAERPSDRKSILVDLPSGLLRMTSYRGLEPCT